MSSKQPNESQAQSHLYQALAVQPPEDRLNALIKHIEEQIITLLELNPGQSKKLERNFVAIGFDSMLAIELQYALQQDLKVAVPPEALEQETIEELAQFLCDKVLVFDN